MKTPVPLCCALSCCCWVALVGSALPARAHDLPLSYVDLRLDRAGIEASVEAPAVDFAHDLPAVTQNVLLTPAGLEKHRQALVETLATRLVIEADGKTLAPTLRAAEPVTDQKDVRLRLRYAWTEPPNNLQVRCRLFPYDPRHKTFLDIYNNGALQQQAIFDKNVDAVEYRPGGGRQSVLAVVGQFFAEGLHHIFIGPDHILFIVGLLLLGGGLKQLLKIVTAFTLAHSVTLALATLGLVNLPARLVEPAIALSIVFVGVHSLSAEGGKRDLRLLFAFVFGFIHGFGFANVLSELDLPRHAVVWSLFSFNLGVEAGQACIVVLVAPLLALLHRRSAPTARRVVVAASLCVIVAGAFWFVQRVT